MNHCLVPLSRIDPTAIELLLDRAFGADRHGRTAYRVREGTEAIPALSFAALREDGVLAGTIQCWPVELASASATHPMIMVGPVAVDPRWQQAGLGKRLMDAMLAAADSHPLPGADSLMLIGDRDYYERFFGFTPERTAGWTLPGPFERDRLLARGPGVAARAGEVRARFVPSPLPSGEYLP